MTSSPVSLERLRQRTQAYLDSKQWLAAQATLESTLRQAPSDLKASMQLSDVLFHQGKLQASTLPLLQAIRALPRDALLISGLVKHLIARGEILAARACLDLLEQAPNPPAELYSAQANLRFTTGEVSEALACMEKAMRAGADSADELHLYAMLLQFNGRIEEACQVLEQCQTRWPHFADAAMVLANLRKQTPENQRLGYFREQLERLPAAPVDEHEAFARAQFEYATFKTLDDLGRHEEAWEALVRCNALMARRNPYDARAEERVTEALLGVNGEFAPASKTPAFDGPTPIFIVGMPRSGTTLLDRILSSHSQVTSAGEIVDFWRQLHWVADVTPAKSEGLVKVVARQDEIDYRLLGQRYLKQTQWRARGRAFYVDKLPGNIQLVGLIRRALPHAPILHMVREPMDTCFSNFKAMFGNVSAYSYDLDALAHYYGLYGKLVRHWHEQFPGTMLDVSYASMVLDPATAIRRVLSHCGLEVEEACLHPERNEAPVATPSSPQVRETIHHRGLGQWRQYERQLEPLREVLQAR